MVLYYKIKGMFIEGLKVQRVSRGSDKTEKYVKRGGDSKAMDDCVHLQGSVVCDGAEILNGIVGDILQINNFLFCLSIQ